MVRSRGVRRRTGNPVLPLSPFTLVCAAVACRAAEKRRGISRSNVWPSRLPCRFSVELHGRRKKNRWDVTVGRSAARSLARDENDDTDCSSAKKTGKNKKENPPPAKQNRDTRRGEIIDTRVHCRRRVVENVGPGGVVVRASAWGTRGRGFESDPGRVGCETYGTYCSSAGHSACESESVVGD